MFIRSRFYLLFFCIIGFILPGNAQCPLTVDAGPDKQVCNSGNSVTLDGAISGPFIGYRWFPAAGLSDPTELNPVATVGNAQTYTLTGAAFDPAAPNLVSNPGFESGNSGFTSGYTYNPLPITPGTYFITPSPELVFSSFPPCDDHTFGDGTGNMMLVNGTGGPNSQVWCQTIPVMPNSWYYMSAWVMSSPISPPVLQFSANNGLIGMPFAASSNGCEWQEFTATWFSANSVSINLCIRDLNGSGNGLFGDDFALDDIFMSKACTVSDAVTVSVVQVNAVLPASITLPCSAQQTGIELNGSASSSGPGYVYSWDGPGILAGQDTPIAIVNEPGTYTLTVTFDTGDAICTDQASINVLPDPAQVTAQAVGNILSCYSPTVMLDGTGSSTGPLVTYSWQPISGILSGPGTLTPEVNQPGVYTLLVTHSISGCTATATAFVGQNVMPATALANAPFLLDCGPDTVALSGVGSSTGNDYSYSWSGPGIVSGNTTLNNCLVNTPGIYMLTVTNLSSGCTAADTTQLNQNGALPLAVVVADTPGLLSCKTMNVALNSTGSSTGAGISYFWGTSNGHITGPADSAYTLVDSAGLYWLTVTNTQNGCSATDSIVINGDYVTPQTVLPLPAPLLNCSVDSLQINASQSSGNGGVSALWTTPDGLILGGDSTLTPWIGSSGMYILQLQDSVSGCIATDSITIMQDTTAPVVELSIPGVLTCVVDSIVLDASGSSSGPGFGLLWTFTPSGGSNNDTGFVSGQTTLSPVVNTPGLYTLLLTDSVNFCRSADSVVVVLDTVLPVAEAGPDLLLTCTALFGTADAAGSSQGNAFQYLWSNGDTTLQSMVNTPGVYQLVVTNQNNGCTAVDSISVTLDTIPPEVIILPPGRLTCATAELNLQATATSDPSTSYGWSFSGPGIGIVQGAASPMPVVGAPGLYTLLATNLSNGCTAVAGVSVQQDTVAPTASAGLPQTLICGNTEIQLDGTLSSSGTGIVYNWTSPDGNIVTGATTTTPVVNTPGLYEIMVTDTTNGCSAQDQVIVQQDANAPVADAGNPVLLTCLSPIWVLDGSGSSLGPQMVYLWSTQDGLIVSGGTTLNPVVGSPGTYWLTVSNTVNNCQSQASVTVSVDNQPPVANVIQPSILTCARTELTLDATGSSTGPGFSYQWSGPGLVSGGGGLSPVVNAEGLYTLTVTDQTNGCTATTSVSIAADFEPPNAMATAHEMLDCSKEEIILNGAGSSQGPGVSYQWTGPGLVSGVNTLVPLVNAAGMYVLFVTDQNNGCFAADTVVVQEDLSELPLITATMPTCSEPSGSLVFSGGSAGPFLYSIDGGQSFVPDSVFASLSGGIYHAVVEGPNGCRRVDTVLMPAILTLEAILPDSVMVNAGESIMLSPLLSLTPDQLAGLAWSPADGLSCTDCLYPLATPQVDVVYSLLVTSLSGCTASTSVAVFIQVAREIYLPNVFSPNGDGLNDFFQVQTNLLVDDFEMKIFDRWGGLLFESRDLTTGWDGTAKGQRLNPGIYAYYIRLRVSGTDNAGEERVLSGDVLVVR